MIEARRLSKQYGDLIAVKDVSFVVLLHQGQVLDQGPVPEVCARAGVRTLTEAFLHYLPSRSA